MNRTIKNIPKSNKKQLTRVQRYSLWFFDHVRVTSILWIGLALFGALSYGFFMRREGFPAVAAPFSIVNGTYFVNDVNKVDAEVAKPIADLIQKRSDVKTVASQSAPDFFAIQIEYKDGTNAALVSRDIEESVASSKLLPATAKATFKPIAIGKLSEEGDDLLVAVSKSAGTSPAELQKIAQDYSNYLTSADGVKSAERAKALELFRTGADPVNGGNLTKQTLFDRIITRENGQTTSLPSATIGIKAKPGVDALHLYDETIAALERAKTDNRFKDVKAVVSADFAESIRAQVSSLQENLIGGLIAVIVISFLLISLRSSIATALAMITVLTITIGVLYVIGYTLNTITLFSLILCLGLIVDDTTIVIEAVDAARRTGGDLRAAIGGAVKKVALASSAGTFVTMLAFAPLLFVSGILGSFIRAIPVTIILSLAVSLLVSLSLVPFLGRFILHSKKVGWSDKSLLGGAEHAVAGGLARLIESTKRSTKNRVGLSAAAILFSLGMFMAGVVLFGRVGFNIFPSTKDSDTLSVSLRFAPDATIQQAQELATSAGKVIDESLGENLKKASLYSGGSSDSATYYIDLVSYRDREVKSPQLVSKLKDSFKDFGVASVEVAQTDVGPPAGAFAVRIYTDDRVSALKLGNDIRGFLKNREVKRNNGTTAHVVETDITAADAIVREQGRQYVVVSAKFDGTDISALTTLMQTQVENEFTAQKVASYGLSSEALAYDFGNESDNQDSFKTMLFAFPVLLVAMYVLLALQFRSLLQPLLIFLALPFSFFGIAAGLNATNNPFSFFTLIGFFALIGISVNNTILLTDYANQGRRSGLRSVDAASEALRHRFRPLLTTSLTSVVALIPLALSDPFWESLAFTLIFGLLSSTLLVLISFPYFYLIAEKLRARFNRTHVLIWLGCLIAIGIIGAVLFGGATAAGIAAAYLAGSIFKNVLLKIRPIFARHTS